jgi:sugar phosphate isomerase/epimerase
VISDEISNDLEAALSVCGELGVHEVELRVVGDDNVVWHDPASLARIRGQFRAGGFSCPVIASPFLKTNPGEVQWEALDGSFEAAHALGAGMVRTFGWLREADPSGHFEQLVDVLAEARQRTVAAGLSLVLENEHACNVATATEAKPVLDRLPGPRFGLIWDPGNEAMAGSQPFPAGYGAVSDRVMHVHVKDVADGRWVRVGAGAIDYAGQLRALAHDGYAGCLSIETHYRLEAGGREAATRECVAALRGLAAAAEVALE